MEKLAINGGTPVRSTAFSSWPIWGDEERAALIKVLDSGVWSVPSDLVDEFAQKYATYQDAKFGICVTSGTTALEAALRSAGVGPGDEVIVPAYTFVASATACLAVGALACFADIDPETWTIDPKSVEERINERTKAIIPVHIGGQPADLDAILDIAGRYNLVVIEDAAPAHSAAWRGRRVGAIGDMGIFSFQSSKNLNAGEGGIIVTDNPEYANKCWSISNLGRVPSGEWYQHELWGSNLRMTQWQAAILFAQMERLDEQNARRDENARYLSGEIAKLGLRPLKIDERVTQHAWHVFFMRFDPLTANGASRKEFVQAVQAEGIPIGLGYSQPLYETNAVRRRTIEVLKWQERDEKEAERLFSNCPVTERACAEESLLIMHHILLGNRRDMNDIVEAIAKVLRYIKPGVKS